MATADNLTLHNTLAVRQHGDGGNDDDNGGNTGGGQGGSVTNDKPMATVEEVVIAIASLEVEEDVSIIDLADEEEVVIDLLANDC